VLERDVAAAFAMGVRVISVRGVLAGLRHGGRPFIRYRRSLGPWPRSAERDGGAPVIGPVIDPIGHYHMAIYAWVGGRR
jgi:hypothetical protein